MLKKWIELFNSKTPMISNIAVKSYEDNDKIKELILQSMPGKTRVDNMQISKNLISSLRR